MRNAAAVRHGDWKLIRSDKGKKRELFNLAVDPYEKKDLAAEELDKVKELEQLLAELRKDDVTKVPEELRNIPKW